MKTRYFFITFVFLILNHAVYAGKTAYCEFASCSDETLHFYSANGQFSFLHTALKPDDFEATEALKAAGLLGEKEFIREVYFSKFSSTCSIPQLSLKASHFCSLGTGTISYAVYSSQNKEFLRFDQVIIQGMKLSEEMGELGRMIAMEFQAGGKGIKIGGYSVECFFNPNEKP